MASQAENGSPALAILEKFIMAQCEWFEANEKVAGASIMPSLKTLGKDLKEKERHSRVFMTKLMVIAQQQGVARNERYPKEISKVIGASLQRL